jgi:hypothetical protein
MTARRRPELAPAALIVWTRADLAALASFDPSTTTCTMNCGPHRLDPRTEAERRLVCGDCLRHPPRPRQPVIF